MFKRNETEKGVELIYEVLDNEKIDNVSIGMMKNNDIKALFPIDIITNDTSQKVLNKWGDHFDGFSNNSPFTGCYAVSFSSAMKGGDAKDLLQLHLYLSNLDYILLNRIGSNISKHLCVGGLPDLSRIGQFHRTF